MARNEITFPDFWQAYALKRDRQRAERAWNRLSARDRQAAFQGIAPYREACQRDGISMMYAQGYLNNRRWEDEAEPLTRVSGVRCQVSSSAATKTEQSGTPGFSAAANLKPETCGAGTTLSCASPYHGEGPYPPPTEPEMLIW